MLTASLLTLGVAAVLMFATWRYPGDLRAAMRVWVGGLILQTAAQLAMSVVGADASILLIVICNTIYALAFAEMGRALRIFAGQHVRLAPLLLVALVALISVVFGLVWNDTRLRIALASVPTAVLQFGVALPILRGRSKLRPADYLTGLIFLACGTLALMRSAIEVLDPVLVSADTHAAIRAGTLVVSAILPTLGTIGFMLMCGDRLTDDLARLAMVDPLTGVYNRRTLSGLASSEIRDAMRSERSLSLLAVDVDHFKRINDQFGHDVGDEALRGLVGLMQESLSEGQTLSRIGGEEFAVLLPGSSEADASLVGERLRRHIERSPLFIDGRPLCLRVSIGVAALDEEIADLASLLRNADRALYSAKRGGRNRVVAASKMVRAPVRALRGDYFG